MLEYIKALGPVVALLLGPWIAMLVYYRQKEYETTKQRYLEGCLDVLAGQLQVTLGTVSHNYARCIGLCKAYRDYGNDFDIADLSKGFLDLDNSKFYQTEHYRLRTLIQSDIAWSFYQAALAYAASADATLRKEIPDAMRMRCKNPAGTSSRETDAEKMLSEARNVHDCSFVYATLQHELNALAAILEREKLGKAEVQAFARRAEVKNAVERLQLAYDALPQEGADASHSLPRPLS
jgi:hypothetical protein